jgi:hypothetical protein
MDDVFQSQRAGKLFRYWRGLSSKGAIPLRRAFDPVDIPEHLRFITMVKPEPDGDYTVALFGTGLRDSIGHEITGKSVFDASIGFDHSVIRFVLDDVVRSGSCFITYRDCELSDGSVWQVQGLTLPLADDAGVVTRIVTYFIPVTKGARELPDYFNLDEVRTVIRSVHRYEISTDTLALLPYP